MVELVIDYVIVLLSKDDKYREEKFLPIVVKLLADHATIAPVIIMMIYRKIYKKLASIKPKVVKSQHARQIESFSSANLHLL